MNRQFSPKIRAFSLVELLVVIGLIALLVGLLMPALGLARERANQTKCLATLRSIGQAAEFHLHEHQNYLPCAGWHWNPIGGIVNPKGLGDEAEKRYDYYYDEGDKRPMPVTAALAQYLGVVVRTDSRQNLEADLQGDNIQRFFHCAGQYTTLSGWTQRDSGDWQSPDEVSSYAFNEAVLGRRDRDPQTRPFPNGQITRVRRPSEVFFALDARPRDPQTDRCFLLFDYGPEDTVEDFVVHTQTSFLGKELIDTFRHKRRVNTLFLDWHAESFPSDAGGLSSIGVSKGVN